MNDFLVNQFEAIRSFFKPRIEEHSKVLNLKVNDVVDEKVRELISRYQFCEMWLYELSVDDWARLALNCECWPLSEIEATYNRTEFGPRLLAEELFCFALTCDGGLWVVSMQDGCVHKIDGTSSDESNLNIVATWSDFTCFIEDIKTTNLKNQA